MTPRLLPHARSPFVIYGRKIYPSETDPFQRFGSDSHVAPPANEWMIVGHAESLEASQQQKATLEALNGLVTAKRGIHAQMEFKIEQVTQMTGIERSSVISHSESSFT